MSNMADRELKLLILEDDANDVELIKRQLRKSGVNFQSAAVCDREGFIRGLEEYQPDVILSDYALPQFNGIEALELLHQRRFQVPFILVTGSQSEEIAVECMKKGADDYILKSAMGRLPAAVLNAHRKREAELERERVQRALRKSEEQYRLITENSRDLICMIDGNGTFLYFSPSFEQVLGYRPEDLRGPGAFFGRVHPNDLPGLMENFRRANQTGEAGRNEFRYLDSNAGWRNMEAIFSPVQDETDREPRAVFVCRDITERKMTEEALRTSEERYALAARGANDGLWDWNLKANQIYFSHRWKAMLGYRENEIGTDPEEWFRRIHPDDLPRVKEEMDAHLQGRIPHFETEHRVLHRDGRYRWMLNRGLGIFDSSGNAYRMAGSQTDITGRKLAEEQLLHNAFYDTLTELPNRAMFMDRLNSAVEQTRRRNEYAFAVLFLDLDRFKVINDSLGHTIGDQLLVAVARRLESCLRAGAMVARLGGDEFAIFLDDIRTVSEAKRVAERIHKELSLPFNLSGNQVFTSASIGINFGSRSYDRAEDVLRDADTAMYRAKAAGKARHEIFQAAMHKRAVEMLQMEGDLRRALENNEFLMNYQPILCLRTGRIVAADALIRWQHPSKGIMFPMEFLPVALETGLFLPIMQWLFQTACSQARTWKDAGFAEIRLSLKYPARLLGDRSLKPMVRESLGSPSLDPANLELAISEFNLAENLDAEISNLRRMQELGVQVSIDDFGSSYSALAAVKRLPIQAVRIKRSLLQGLLSGSSNDEAIVTAVVTLARSMKLRVTAQGVETVEQVNFLRSLDCDEIEGYLCGRPVTADVFLEALDQNRAQADNPEESSFTYRQ